MNNTPQRKKLSVRMENMSLEEQETENRTENFSRCSLGRTVINRTMKCDQQKEITSKFI